MVQATLESSPRLVGDGGRSWSLDAGPVALRYSKSRGALVACPAEDAPVLIERALGRVVVRLRTRDKAGAWQVSREKHLEPGAATRIQGCAIQLVGEGPPAADPLGPTPELTEVLSRPDLDAVAADLAERTELVDMAVVVRPARSTQARLVALFAGALVIAGLLAVRARGREGTERWDEVAGTARLRQVPLELLGVPAGEGFWATPVGRLRLVHVEADHLWILVEPWLAGETTVALEGPRGRIVVTLVVARAPVADEPSPAEPAREAVACVARAEALLARAATEPASACEAAREFERALLLLVRLEGGRHAPVYAQARIGRARAHTERERAYARARAAFVEGVGHAGAAELEDRAAQLAALARGPADPTYLADLPRIREALRRLTPAEAGR